MSEFKIARVLAALDESAWAADVLHAAGGVARKFGAKLFLFRSVAVPPYFPPAAHMPTTDPLPAALEARAIADLKALLAGEGDLQADGMHFSSGQRPWQAIIGCADSLHADLIVLGSHGFAGFDHLLGTTAGKVTTHARCNVLVVPHQSPPVEVP